MRDIKSIIKNPLCIGGMILRKYFAKSLPDKIYLKLLYFFECGHVLNLVTPKKFTEKLQWLKLYNRNPLYTTLVDKFAVKKYVADIIGEEYIIPTLGVWEHPEDIDFESLPNKFVLKTTHGGGGNGVIICNDKSIFDQKDAIRKLQRAIKSNIYLYYREWPYKDVPKRIIAEQYMEDFGINTSCLTDYKFFCFDGEPRYCQVIKDRNTHETIDFFDMDWNHQEFVGLNPKAVHAKEIPVRPLNFEQMKLMARSLAVGETFSRVDLYEINNKAYFGEITLFPASGFGKFTPGKYDEILGRMLRLNGKIQRGGDFRNFD